MRDRLGSSGAARARRTAGFSLIELMTVVTMVGVLAALAIPTFTGYVFKSRTSEAPQFLGTIKLRQEAYKSEFSQYLQIKLNTNPNAMEYAPGNASVMMGSTTQAFPGTCSTCNPADWNQLGANPGGMVRFGYGIAAGGPASAPTGSPYNFVADDWYIAQAVADLDADGAPCLFEVYSQTNKVYFEPAKGWE